jgi:hypothetical protein
MRFPEKGSEHFSDEEIKLLKAWKRNIKRISLGKRIIENFEKDPHVPNHIWIRFLKNLLNCIKEEIKDLDSIRKAITDDMLLNGPDVGKKELGDSLLRLITIKSLLKRYVKESIPIFKDKISEEKVGQWINDGTITIEKHFKDAQLRGERPISWATFVENVDDDLVINGNIDDLCDRLGLMGFNKCDYVLELRYNVDKIKKFRLPTVIDAEINAAFCPSSEEDRVGYTHDLKNNCEGFPEVIHEPIDIKKIDSIRYLGHKNRNASSIIS